MKHEWLRWSIFGSILTGLSALLMWHTFGYDSVNSAILISRTAWSDFGAHIPVIRSFSLGDNWPPEYPIFPGSPIRVHFLFYAVVGWLEKFGMPLDWALNLPSVIGMVAFLMLLAGIAYRLTGDFRVAVLSSLFVILNGSLTFVRFFETRPVNLAGLNELLNLHEFVSFAPWGPGMISAFWTLNIYTNQRHLALGYAISLLILFLSIKPPRSIVPWILLALLLGIVPILHQPTMLIALFVGGYAFLTCGNTARKGLILTATIAAPLAFWSLSLLDMSGEKQFGWKLGYLLEDPVTPERFIEYWFQNLGLHSVLIILAFLFAFKKLHRVLVPALALFIFVNTVKISIEVAGGHKFVNFAGALGGIGSAYLLVKVWDSGRNFLSKAVVRPLVVAALVILTFSGVVDLLPIINDRKGDMPDRTPRSPSEWFYLNTPKDAVCLNSTFTYHPASIAGRKIFMGWPYFSWSAGYTEERMKIMKEIYESQDRDIICDFLEARGIGYMTVEDTGNDENLPRINVDFFLKTATPDYADEVRKYYIYSTKNFCG